MALTEQQEHVVKRMGPGSYAESAQQVKTAEKQSRNGAKYEGIDLEMVTERADIVEGGENERSENCRGDAGDERAPAQQFARSPGDESHEHDAEQQLLVDAGPQRQHQHCPAAQALRAESEG